MNGADPLLAALHDMAEDACSFLSAYGPLQWGQTPQQEAVASHAAQAPFQEALSADPLAQLYPDGQQGYVFLSTGSVLSINRESLAWNLLGTAGWELLMTRGHMRLEEYRAQLEHGVDRLRGLLAGETVEVPALLAFAGVQMAAGLSLELPWGRLYPPTGLADTFADWSRSDLLLEAQLPLRMVVVEPGPDATPPNGFEGTGERQQLELLEAKTVLALLLGVDNGKPAVVRMWRMVLSPFQASGYSTEGGGPRPLYGTQAFVGPDERGRLQATAVTIADRHEPRLSPAVRRAVSSVTARLDPADGLIDAVIALEALFAGTDKSELRFRIAAAAAWLLEPDDAAGRHAVFREVRGLYDARSKVVHGQGGVTDAQLLRDRAFTTVVKSLRELYERLPELLGDDQRSARIILHTPLESSSSVEPQDRPG